MAESFPLVWPRGYPRTLDRSRSRFKIPRDRAVRELFHELKLLGAPNWRVILSTNVQLRRDGMPYANTAQPQDTGAAVYFRLEEGGVQRALCCDKWDRVEDNIHTLALTVKAMRDVARWGASDMLDRMFQGFSALPAPAGQAGGKSWWEILGCERDWPLGLVEERYRKLAIEHHPDRGGSPELMKDLTWAIAEARKARGAA